MLQLISGLACCDFVTKDDGKQGLSFNAGRLVGALLLAGGVGTATYFFFPERKKSVDESMEA